MEQNLFEAVYREIFPFWDEISESDRECICRNSFVQTYPKGANIHSGNECSGVIFVRSGSLRLYIMSEDGKDITLYRLHKVDMCMLSASCVLKTKLPLTCLLMQRRTASATSSAVLLYSIRKRRIHGH